MKEENNNNVNEQQITLGEKKKVAAACRKITAIADKITDDYNDDFTITPNHELLAIGVFLHRMETSLTDKDAIRKDGKPWGDLTPGSTEEPTLASMLDVIKKGYEIGEMLEGKTSEELGQTSEDNGE